MQNKTMTRRGLALALAALLMLSLLPVAAFAADGYEDGTYLGTGEGRNGEITLSVTVLDGKITAIETVSQRETEAYWEEAAAIFQRIIDANSTQVDGVTGATLSCDGIKAAVNDALSRASAELSGSGTQADPYRISTPAQLKTFAERVDSGVNYAGEYVVLTANLQLDSAERFNPIGAEGKTTQNKDRLFAGTFDGRGHTISGLTITGSYESEVNLGLFSALGGTALVRNLTLRDVNIAVDETAEWTNLRAGGIAGDTQSGSPRGAVVDGCTVSGRITVTAADGQAFAGGILGRAFTGSAVINCVSDTDVHAASAGNWNASYAGVLAGMTGNNTVLANCAAFGSASAENTTSTNADAYAGGLAGMLSSSAWNDYAASAVSVAQKAEVQPQYAGLLAGQAAGSAQGGQLFYAADAALSVNGTAVTAAPWAENLGLIREESVTARALSELALPAFADALNGGVGAAIAALEEPALVLREWALKEGRVLPSELPWTPDEIDAGVFASGTGTQEDPFLIETKAQLKAFAASVTEKADYTGMFVRLAADIDLSGEDWAPIGGSYGRFNGTFDGAGHTVTGLTEGSAEQPRRLDGDSSCIGFFGWLKENAVVRDLTLDRVSVYTHSPGSAYVGGIAGRISGSDTEGDYRGALVDGCAVRGVISHTTDAGTTFVGGIGGHVFKGAIINTMTDVQISCVERSGQLAEVGGVAGLLNRGVIANCYALGDVTGSGYRDTQQDIEGMACVGNLAAVNGGCVVNCYGEGGVEALEYSIDTGVLTGWVTGIAKVYDCWYNEAARMVIDGRTVSPVDPYGEIVAGGVSDEWGFRFPGSLLENNNGYTPGADGAVKVADGLNGNFAAFSIDLEGVYGLPQNCLRRWTVAGNRAVLSEEHVSITYVQPEVEKNLEEEPETTLLDGEWFGRSQDKSTVVAITVKDGAVTDVRLISGDAEGTAYDEAVARAQFKATWGDTTDYSQADAVHFSGTGTEADPYLISSEADLRALSASIDEDVDWAGVCFKQTRDITITGGDWEPIGWGIFTDADDDGFGYDLVALYPFRGSYDGGKHVIRGLTVGSPDRWGSGNWTGLFGIIQGDYTTNEIPQGEANLAALKNIRLEDVSFCTEGRWRNYVGGLVGNAQGGFVIDHCSVTGRIISRSTEDFAYAGGLAGSLMYGCVTDCWTDVDASGWSGKNYSYTAGLSAVTNRSTIVDCYTLGDVHGDADQTNRAGAGGFIALDGGVCINCYARGSAEILSKYSMYLGGFVGMAASSSEHRQCYYNTDADQKIAGEPVAEKRYAGKFVNESAEAFAQAQSGAVMVSEDFAALLNANRTALSETLSQVCQALGADENGSSRYHSVYYHGDGSDLRRWVLSDGVVGFEPDACDGGERCPSKVFEDVDQNLWYHEAVDWSIVHGVFRGMSATTFEPNTPMTRAMLVTVLHRMAGEPAAKTEAAFTDLKQDWYREAVSWAAEQRIVLGMSAAEFAPDALITREQAATMLHRYAAFFGVDTSERGDFSGFTDGGRVSAWATDAMRWAVGSGLINGKGNGVLDPSGSATRAELAAILQRFTAKTA